MSETIRKIEELQVMLYAIRTGRADVAQMAQDLDIKVDRVKEIADGFRAQGLIH